MPRKLNGSMSVDSLESEAMFTLAMLRADPYASTLASKAEGWQRLIDQLRTDDQAFRQQEADVDALRVSSNQYLDQTCRRFGNELYLACGQNKNSTRWQRYFTGTISEFVRQSLARQTSLVQSWLLAGSDEILEKYRGDLERWSGQCDSALQATDAVTIKRRDRWSARDELAATLTRERDALHRSLAELAETQGLERGWPDVFFRVDPRPKEKDAENS